MPVGKNNNSAVQMLFGMPSLCTKKLCIRVSVTGKLEIHEKEPKTWVLLVRQGSSLTSTVSIKIGA